MKNIRLIICCLLLGNACMAQDTLKVKGEMSGDSKGYNKIFVYGPGVKTDTVQIVNGLFEFNIPFKSGMLPLFYTEYSMKVRKMLRPFPAVVDTPGTLFLKNAEFSKEINLGRWKGIRAAEEYQQFNDSLSGIYTRLEKLKISESQMDSITKVHVGDLLDRFVDGHPDSYASVYALNNEGRGSLDGKEIARLYAKLSSRQQHTALGLNLSTYLTALKKSAVGSRVEDFTLAGPDGKTVTFSSLKGKYVVLDFWASWCGPCKASFPHMKEIYDAYKSKNFEIYSISIDKNKEAWLKESEKQALPWLQTLDTLDISQNNFAISAVPTTFLIDPKGKIVLKEIGFDPSGTGAIEKKLKSLFVSK